MMTLYLAGGLFNAAERLHNLYLEKHLKELGYTVILPQREALKHLGDTDFDIDSLRNECREFCNDSHILYVGCIDGPDADSGTAVEYGIAITATYKAIVYRTDFRTSQKHEIGINAMFGLQDTEIVIHPCYFTELEHVDAYYRVLAVSIHRAVQRMSALGPC